MVDVLSADIRWEEKKAFRYFARASNVSGRTAMPGEALGEATGKSGNVRTFARAGAQSLDGRQLRLGLDVVRLLDLLLLLLLLTCISRENSVGESVHARQSCWQTIENLHWESSSLGKKVCYAELEED